MATYESKPTKTLGDSRGIGRMASSLFRRAALVLAFSISAGAAIGQTQALIRLPDGAAYPNGIASAPDGTLYIGLITDGRILRRHPSGNWTTIFPGSEQIFAGTTLRLDEKRQLLWGASPDFLPQGRAARPHRIYSFDLEKHVVGEVLELPDGGFGNDIALTSEGDLFVTDSLNGRVLRLPAGSRSFSLLAQGPLLMPVGPVGVAGIALSKDGRMIAGNFGSGRLAVLDQHGLHELLLPRLIENPDGLAFAPDGALIVLEGAVKSGDAKCFGFAIPSHRACALWK